MTSTEKNNAWIERYSIMSLTGRFYTRKMLLDYIAREWPLGDLNLNRSDIAAVIDDDAWLRLHKGTIPAAVSKAAISEALRRQKQTASIRKSGAAKASRS